MASYNNIVADRGERYSGGDGEWKSPNSGGKEDRWVHILISFH